MLKTDAPEISSIASLQFFFNEMKMSFQNADNSVCEKHALDFIIADRPIRIHLAGNGLMSVICPALAHLNAAAIAPPALEIFIWDQKSTGTPIPDQPWEIPPVNGNATFIFPQSDSFRINISGDREMLSIGDRTSNQIFIWIKDASKILTHDYAAPLMHVFRTWSLGDDLGIVHAGCVGNDSGAVLL